MNEMKRLPWFHILYLLAFIEGGALMAIELIGSKIIAPYYGGSLYTWTAVLATTLGGLALGYQLGGTMSSKHDNKKLLFYLFLLSGLLVIGMRFYGPFVLEVTLPLEIRVGVTISSFFILTPILMCFGMVSPLIINTLYNDYGVAGKSAGTVYAISTFGGVLFCLPFGLYVIPFIGIKISLLIIGGLLLAAGIMYKAVVISQTD